MRGPIRVLILDDHRLFTQALQLLLRGEEGINVVGTVETGEEALEFCERTPVDVALVDIDLPGMDGVATTAALRERHPEAQVVVITAFQGPDVMARAVRAGACGYVVKTDAADTLVGAIRLAMAGKMVLPAGNLSQAVSPFGRTPAAGRQPAGAPVPGGGAAGERPGGPLSERELQILEAIAGGTSTLEMADTLLISENTVRSHVKSILAKLEVHSKAEAVMKAVRMGLIRPDAAG